MKTKLYTLSHDVDLLKKVDNKGGRFTGDEHSFVTENELRNTAFKSKDNLLYYYLSGNYFKLEALNFCLNFITEHDYKNILSLGAGECVLEWLLKTALHPEAQIYACDFDAFFIKKANEFFPDIIAYEFDFFCDDVVALQQRSNAPIDLAIFWGAAYVMDDDEFIKLFKGLKRIGLKHILDFHAGYLDMRRVLKNYLKSFLRIRSPKFTDGKYQGKFHGYGRSRRELRRLYEQSELEVQKEIRVGGYKYVAVLA